MKIKIKTKFITEQEAILVKDKYRNGRTALSINSLNGEPLCRATVNLEHVNMDDDCVLIKDYSENEGVLNALIEAKVISEPLAEVPTGFVLVQMCRLLV